MIVFAPRVEKHTETGQPMDVIGDWYGYVGTKDVPPLLDMLVKGEMTMIQKWRGCMGLDRNTTQSLVKKICEDLEKCQDCADKNQW